MYISVNDAASKFNISKRRVQTLCEQGRISGANMVSGVWLIPKNASKPIDRRRKLLLNGEMGLFDQEEKILTIDDVCKLLSISKATAKNWIRLKKIIPDAGEQLFTNRYIEKFTAELKSDDSTKLKSRRNKKNAYGKLLYKDYIHTESNQKLVSELLELDIIKSEKELLVVLANFAIQLYYQRNNIFYSQNNVIFNFISQSTHKDFHILIEDLIGNDAIESNLIEKLSPALTKRVQFVKGEDTLGFLYISLRDIGHRKSTGAYYTPERIVNQLIENLYDNDNDLNSRKICDPCCGTGNFLLNLGLKGIEYSNLYGQDNDPISVYITRINLALMTPEIPASDICSRIIIGNTYFETFPQKFDIILGNPPWGSDFSEKEALKCRSIFKTAVGKSLESYDIFIEKSLSMLCDNGVLAFVLPEAVLNVTVHEPIRKLIIESCSFKFVSYLGNVFSGVQCPAIILGITLDHRKTVVGCKITTSKDKFTIMKPRCFDNNTFSFNASDEQVDCLNNICNIKNVAYLKDNARFALGIVTGNNNEFIFHKKSNDNEVILKGSDIQRYNINITENFIRFTPESFQQVAPLEMYHAKEKLLYRFISEVPVFAYDDKQTLSLNSCNIVVPEIPGLETKYVLAILNSSVTAYYTSKKFNSVKLLRSHIEQIPIPVVPLEVQRKIIKKVDRIMNSSENISGLYTDLDNEIFKLFGLSIKQSKIIVDALNGKNLFLKTN